MGAIRPALLSAILLLALLSGALTPVPLLGQASDPLLLVQGQQEEPEENETVNFTDIGAMARIQTSWGTITVGLYTWGAPITTSNFIGLVESAFFDGIKFHRVVDDFVIQTGDPNTKDDNPYNDGTGGSTQTIPLETHPELTHIDGALGMARELDDENSATSQFYICDGPQHQLDGDYAVFGVVVEGMDVVRRIAQAEVYGNKRPLLSQHPVDDIVIEIVEMIPLPDEGPDEDPGTAVSQSTPVQATYGFVYTLGIVAIVTLVVLGIAQSVRVALWRLRRRRGDARPPSRDQRVLEDERDG